MKTRLKVWPWALAMTSAAVFVVTAPMVRAEVGGEVIIGGPPATVVTYHYVYYPDVEVYFVPETKVYFWFDGSAWRSIFPENCDHRFQRALRNAQQQSAAGLSVGEQGALNRRC